MNHNAVETQTDDQALVKMEGGHSSKGDLIVTGVATAVVASTLMKTGKGIATTLAKHPVVILGLGVLTGYLAHKYRKNIHSVSQKTAKESKEFVVRQKENLKEFFSESQE